MAKYRHYRPSKEEMAKYRREQERLESCVISAMDRWDIDDIMDVVSDRVQQSTRSTKKELIEKMAEIMNEYGYSVIKTDNLQDQYALKDLVAKNLFSYTDMNRNCLFPS